MTASNRSTRVARRLFSGLAVLTFCEFADSAHAATPEPRRTAAALAEHGQVAGGICCVVGADDADLALSFAKVASFTVHCLHSDADVRTRLTKTVRSRGMYGTVSVAELTPGRLPYVDNLINVLVADSRATLATSGIAAAEILRVLAPLGMAYVRAEGGAEADALRDSLAELTGGDVQVVEAGGKWLSVRKPWPNDIDEWGHFLHGPDSNPVARDTVVGPPEHYQWVSDPMWLRSHETDSSIGTMVTAGGRLFYIEDQAPIGLAGEHDLPDNWQLVARDAFNGVFLWQVPIRRWGWREWKPSWFNTRPGDVPLNVQKRLVATRDKVYITLGYQAPVSQLDARTGDVLQTYAGTERTNEMLLSGDVLILSVLSGDGVRIKAVQADSGSELWATKETYKGSVTDYVKWKAMHGNSPEPKLDPAPNISTDGKVVALIDGTNLACVDFATGAEKWRVDFPEAEADRSAGGIKAGDNLWVGTVIASHDVVLHASPNKLAGFAADTGKLLWEQPKRYIGHLWYEWKDVFVIDGLVWTWHAELERTQLQRGGGKKGWSLYPRKVNGYDITSGELKREVDLGFIFKSHHHHRCYRNKATSRYILASRRGTEFVDLIDGKHTVHNWVRGTCHVGMMPANGLHYAPPHPCACYIDEKLSGLNALAPAKPGEGLGARSAERGLDKGPAFDSLGVRRSAFGTPSDWPAFRHDSLRTGAVDTALPDDIKPLWSTRLGGKLSAPISVAEKVFVSLVDEHHVACLDVADGTVQWEFGVEGRVDSPPTWHAGTVIFGSADGAVYCVRTSDGQLVWRFRAVAGQRLMCAYGQLESAWPVHGSVLVQDGVAYFAGGRSSQLDGGIHVYGLDAATGDVKCETKLEGPDYTVDDLEENFAMPMGTISDVLMSDGTTIHMGPAAFDPQLKRVGGKAALQARHGLLDDTYFKRTPWTFGGEYARLLVHDKDNVYYVRMFDSLRGLDPSVYFTPGANGYLLFAKGMTGNKKTWMERIRVRIRAMVLARNRLVVAGPPDDVTEKDPLGAFGGRQGGVLCLIDAGTGEKVSEQKLTYPPVFNGAAAANGRLFIAQTDGSLVCFGK